MTTEQTARIVALLTEHDIRRIRLHLAVMSAEGLRDYGFRELVAMCLDGDTMPSYRDCPVEDLVEEIVEDHDPATVTREELMADIGEEALNES